MALSVCLVTRNHGPSLGRAIRSVAGLAAEVVVADTGSTDDTVDVAKQNNARVVSIGWADDFSAACNSALDAATGDWILWLNPDEEVEPAGVELMAEAVADPAAFAWQALVREQLRRDDPQYGTSGWQIRLYRRDPAVRYRGRLHPAFVQPLDTLARDRGLWIKATNAVIRRHAYLSSPTPDKMRWVVRLLEAELRDRPGQIGFTIELGRNLLWLNDPRGHEVLAQAAEQVRPHAAAGSPSAPSPWVGSLIEYLLSVSAGQSRSGVTRAEARAWAGAWFAKSPPVIWAVASERYAAGDYAIAADHLQRLVEIGRTGGYVGEGFDPVILGASAVQNLGLCCLHLGWWDEAKVCFTEAAHDPAFREVAAWGLHLAVARQRPTV